jgi:glycosylphosphatidylinositol transamidase (GPIT) subunit GPI8
MRLWLLFSLTEAVPDLFAVLVAGSKGFMNYRHQADVCFQYHLLVDLMGVPASNVRVLMYDDVAWSPDNPLIGRLYNEPEGVNVYKGCVIDYSGEDVNVGNFFHTVSSLPTNMNSTIIISYVDHGEPGALLFPTGERMDSTAMEYLLHTQLPTHKRVLFYVEACNAGSVFESIDFTQLANLLVVTASSGTEFSWATYCPVQVWADKVHGRHIGVCLGDLFSVAWTRDLALRLILGIDPTETVREHVESITSFVDPKSTVSVFGDENILKEKLWNVFKVRNESSTSNGGISGILMDDKKRAHDSSRINLGRSFFPELNFMYLL